MKWTKRHSKNAVAAKAIKRMSRAEPSLDQSGPKKIFVPRRHKPDFIVRIESRSGERIQISVYRFLGRVRTSDGKSARQLCRGLEQLFTKSA